MLLASSPIDRDDARSASRAIVPAVLDAHGPSCGIVERRGAMAGAGSGTGGGGGGRFGPAACHSVGFGRVRGGGR